MKTVRIYEVPLAEVHRANWAAVPPDALVTDALLGNGLLSLKVSHPSFAPVPELAVIPTHTVPPRG